MFVAAFPAVCVPRLTGSARLLLWRPLLFAAAAAGFVCLFLSAAQRAHGHQSECVHPTQDTQRPYSVKSV